MAVKRVGKSRRKSGEVIPAPEPVVVEEPPAESLFDDEPVVEALAESDSVFADEPGLAPPAPAEIVAVEKDLTPDQRAEFEALLNTKMTLEERANRLVTLGRMHGTKTAAVGLRAIMEINRVTRLTEHKPNEAPAMFQLPPETRVSVTVEKVVK